MDNKNQLQNQPPLTPIGQLDKAVDIAVTEINKSRPKVPVPVRNEPPEFRFVSISDNLVETIVTNAQAQLTKAENNLKLAEQMAEDIRGKAKHIWEMLQQFERELEDYGEATLSVHERFMRKGGGNSK